MTCEKCGGELRDGVRFCKNCGHPVSANPAQKQPKKKKKKGCLIGLLLFLVIVVSIFVCAAILLPGFFRPKDLGIKPSEAAYESAVAKLNYQKDAAPSAGKAEDYNYIYGEPKEINTSLTSEELTSFFNYNRPEFYALKKVQIKINPDDTVDFSASVDTSYLIDKVLAGKYSEKAIADAFPLAKAIPGSVNVYAKLSGEIADNKAVDFAFSHIEVMGVGLPAELYATESAKTEISSILDNFLANIAEKTKGSFTSVAVENGELQLSGMLPSSLKREAVN